MSLIFDGFESEADARAFVSSVQEIRPGRECQVFPSVAAAQRADLIPVELGGVVVHVGRLPWDTVEEAERDEVEIMQLVRRFTGSFAGT